jgi:hypothetical protein
MQKSSEPQIERQIEILNQKLNKLRILYDHYFMGLEKIEPLKARQEVEKFIQNLQKVNLPTTPIRFKFQTLVWRYNTYLVYWNRISRQIEEGRYKRDIERAKKRQGEILRKEIAEDPLSQTRLQKIYQLFVSAQKKHGDIKTKVTFEALQRKLKKMVPIFMEKHKCKDVNYKIVIQNGKVGLRILPKKSS